ncbi:MAG: DUF1700 domain-containing protein [Bacilli bacterium]|jgi:uncharacterized membrane protein
MLREAFLAALESELSSLNPGTRKRILDDYKTMIEKAVRVGRDEEEFIADLGPVETIAKQATPKVATIEKEPLPLNDQLILALTYFIVGIIALAMIGLALGVGSTALALLASGIGRLALEGRTVTGGGLTLYIGQIVLASGLLLMIVGGLTKFSGLLRKLVAKLHVKLGGARHE